MAELVALAPYEKLIVVVGPTATGKTTLALRLARSYDGEVIGADAYQVYRGMDIGTAKPTIEELDGIRHHLIDVVDPNEKFDAHRYVELANAALSEALDRGKTAIVAGGTGLYVRALIRGLADMPGADAGLRALLHVRAADEGSEALHEDLSLVDPEYAARIASNDLVRIIRALEVHTLTGRTITAIHHEHQRQPDRYQTLWLGLDPGRSVLRERIRERTDQMFESGFVDEVRRLLDAGYGPELPPMRALGYQPVCQLLDGAIDETEARRLTFRDTARYAKRQRNWFRSEKYIHWFDGPEVDVAEVVASFLSRSHR